MVPASRQGRWDFAGDCHDAVGNIISAKKEPNYACQLRD